MLDPIAVALKFGFLAVLYLFLLWMARSAVRDLRSPVASGRGGHDGSFAAEDEATGLHEAATGPALLRVISAAGLEAGSAYDVGGGALLGRGPDADIQLLDGFASTRHARLARRGDRVVVEDLGSTNGTYLNGDPLNGIQPLHPGDLIRIGDAEFRFER